METSNGSTVKIIDKMIFIFMIIFLLSLSNSIFVNQLGYYGALILILARYFITRENQFEKTGLEFVFVWFLLAEFLSALFSINHSLAFTNVLKRALLIPIVYTTIVASTDIKRAKLFFKIYIGATLITVLIYLFFAYKFYIYNLYSITQSGPSLFQYPITASEIISFTVVFMFAFLLNEKTSFKYKVFYFIAFAISFLALISTYKRTGWLGATFGIFLIILIKKEWRILIPMVALAVMALLVQKNVSQVYVYQYNNSKLVPNYSISTNGRAYNIYNMDGYLYISDYEDGLLKYKDSTPVSKLKLNSPILSFQRWKDNYYIAYLIDTRFILLRKEAGRLIKVREFISPGFTEANAVANNFLYVLDSDSGVTVFKDPENLKDSVRYSSFAGSVNMYADSNYIILYTPPRKIEAVPLTKGLPTNKILTYNDPMNIDFVFYNSGKLFVSDSKGLKLLSINTSEIKFLDQTSKIVKAYKWNVNSNRLFAANLNGDIYELAYPVNNKIKILSHNKIDFIPSSIYFTNNHLYITLVKRSRLLSIFDPYLPSNFTRLELWRAGIKIFKDYPILGVGDIDLRNTYKVYKNYYDKEIQGHLHNNFFHILATLGLFGFLAVCYLFIRIYIIEFKIYNETIGIPFISSYALGAIGAFSAFIISGLTELNFGDHEIITLVWFTTGLNLAFYHLTMKKKQNS